jgi:hypothetical protein
MSSHPCMGGVGDVRHTVKPLDDAQTLVPSELKMAALSTLPVPTRLQMAVSVFDR